MATFNIVIQTQVNQAVTGIRQVGNELSNVEKAANRLRSLIQQTFAIAGIGFGIRELVSLTDTYIKLENRIRLVTKSQSDLEFVMSRLFSVAQKTRQSFDSTVTLFTRMASSTSALGISQARLLSVVESVNKAVAISGATSIEAKNALIQFSQGLASGRLGGEELRSVLEQLPAIADVIARKLNVTRGELRGLAAQGKLTPRVIIDAFEEAEGYLSDEFAKTVPTLGQSFQILQDQLLKFIGEVNRSSGAGETLAKSIIFLANNMDTLLDIVVTLSIAWALRFVPALIASTTAALSGVGAFFSLAVGVTSLAQAQALAAAATVGWAGALGVLKLAMLSLPLLALAYGITRLITGSGEVLDATNRYNQALGEFSGIVNKIVTSSGERRTKLIEDSQAIIKQQIKELESLSDLTDAYAEAGKNGLFGALGVGVLEGAGRLGIGQAPSDVMAKADKLREIIKKMKGDLNEAINPTKPSGTGGGGSGAAEKLDTFAATVKKLQDENIALGLSKSQRELANKELELEFRLRRSLTPEQRTQYQQLLAENQLLKDKADILDSLRQPQEDLVRGTAALNALMKEGKISTEEYSTKLRGLTISALAAGRDMASGIQRGLLQIQEEFGNVADLASKTLVDSFRKAEDAMVEFARNGKFSFKDLVNSILEDLTRLAIRQNVTAPIANLLGGLVTPGSTTTSGGGTSGMSTIAGLVNKFGSLFTKGLGGGNGNSGLWDLTKGTGGQNYIGALFNGNNTGQNGLPWQTMGNVNPRGGFYTGFATGGSFTVGGYGGTDSQLMQFMATPGEMVNISRPSQQPSNDNAANSNSRQAPIINNWNITTKDANSFKASQAQLESQAARMISRGRRNN